MKHFWRGLICLLLLVLPLELSARHVVRHHRAQAQTAGCGVGQTPPSTGCGIGDMAVGGALSATDAIAICQQGSGACKASSPTWQLTQVPLLSSIRGGLSATPPIGYVPSTGVFSLTGTIPITNLAGGTGASSSTFLRGDNTWAAPPTGSGGGVNSGTLNQLAYYGATGAVVSGLAAGSNGQVLTLTGGVPTWAAASGGATTITLAPGLTNPATGGYNTGTQTVTNGGTIAPQLLWEGHSSSYTLLATDSAKLLEATGSGVTFSVPAPGVPGSAGYSFSYSTGIPYILSTTTGAQIYGCGPSGQTITASFDVTLISNGTNWKCSAGPPSSTYAVSWGPGMNLATSPIPIITRTAVPSLVTGVYCVVGVAAPAAASVDLYYAPDSSVPPGGTGSVKINSSTCNAAGTPGLGQGLTVAANTTIPAGNHVWAVGTGWTGSLTSVSGYIQIGMSP